MKRTTYSYVLKTLNADDKRYEELESFEKDFIAFLEELIKKDKAERKWEIRTDKKVFYISDYTFDKAIDTVFLKFVSAKYDSVRTVVDTNTLLERTNLQKGKMDGEEEYNHMALRFKNDKAFCVYESNSYGVGFAKVIKCIERQIKAYHANKGDNIRYNILYSYVVADDFLKALENIRRIKMLTIEVEREKINVSEQKKFAGRNDLSNTADIVFRPSAKGMGIFSDTVKDFFCIYNDENSSVKSVTVSGEDENKDPIRFDTDAVKQKDIVEVDVDVKGQVKASSIFPKLEQIIMRL